MEYIILLIFRIIYILAMVYCVGSIINIMQDKEEHPENLREWGIVSLIFFISFVPVLNIVSALVIYDMGLENKPRE